MLPKARELLQKMMETPIPEARRALANAMIQPLVPRWVDAPEPCPECGERMKRSVISAGGPYSGTVKCTKCTYQNSVIGHLGKTAFIVEPL